MAASLVTLAVTGVLILMVHPRLYWGEAGNDLTPAFLELPISRNHKHGGWENRISFFQDSSSPVSASRTFDIFNQNGWGRSLHFLAAWLLVIPGVVYLLAGISSGHFRFHIWPRAAELTPRRFWQEVVDHLHLRIRPATGGPQDRAPSEMRVLHGGLRGFPALHSHRAAMSPAVTAAFPFLLSVFGGYQSARTIHFFAFTALVVFVIAHVVMVVLSGFARQMRGMIFGR